MKGANGQEVENMKLAWGGLVEIDAEIAPIVKALNDSGLPTRASCSGHGVRPGSIMLVDGDWLYKATPDQARQINALFQIGVNGDQR